MMRTANRGRLLHLTGGRDFYTSLFMESFPMCTGHWIRLSLLVGIAACAGTANFASASDLIVANTTLRAAEEILAEIDRTVLPPWDSARAHDEAYRAEANRQFEVVLGRRAVLIDELWQVDSSNPDARRLIVERWRILGQFKRGKEAASEIDAYFQSNLPATDEAAYFAALLELEQIAETDAQRLAAVERFRTRSPGSKALQAIVSLAADKLTDDTNKIALLQEARKAAENAHAARIADGKIRRIQELGQPFELTFTDAVTDQPLAIRDLKGKVIIIEFWATWCGPCRAFLPELRKLYDAHHGNGLEIISVSLDAPGDAWLAKVRDAINEEGMTWHHYHQENGFESQFSASWGIDSIPAIFVIDQNGNLVHTDARPLLGELIPSLLASETKSQDTTTR